MADVAELERLFYQVVEGTAEPLDMDRFKELLADASQLRIYLPDPPVDSSISAPYMRAFLEMQTQINALAAKARGKANAGGLSKRLKQDLEIHVVVGDGSAHYLLEWSGALQKAIGQMTGRQVQATIIVVTALVCTTWGTTTWMEGQRQVQLEQIKSQEHIQALDALKFASARDVGVRERMVDALIEQVELGRDIANLADSAIRQVMRAAATSNRVEINGQPVTGEVADLLTISPRSQLTKVQEVITARVIDINTEDLLRPVVEMQDAETGSKFRFRMEDNLFAEDQRTALFDALKTGDHVDVRVEVTRFEEDVRGVEFVTLP